MLEGGAPHTAAPVEQIEVWAERVLSAATLAELSTWRSGTGVHAR